MYKYLFLICFGIIIFMLLNHIDTFNISSQEYITTGCDNINLANLQNINEIKEYWKEGYKTSNNIHYINIKSFNNITYKLSIVLTDKVVSFMEYSSDFLTKNADNFLSNLCRLLEKLQYIVTQMCKNLEEIYVQQIATISINITTPDTTTLLIENEYETNHNIYDNILKNIRCIYIYLDKYTVDDANEYYMGQYINPIDISFESLCDVCPFTYLKDHLTEDGRNFCSIRDISCLGGSRLLPSNINALSDIYHFDPEYGYSNTYRPYNSIVFVHEFAHNIMENGIANGNRSKRLEFNSIYDNYKSFIDSHDTRMCMKSDKTISTCPGCNDIYACSGNCAFYGNDNICNFKGRELFAISSETWFGVNLTAGNTNIYINTTDNIFTNFPDLYYYLNSVYGPPNNLCQNSTILQHYEICLDGNQDMLRPTLNQCSDNPNFNDMFGNSCNIWINDNCDRAEFVNGYTSEETNRIKLNCPRSCKICSESRPDMTASVSSGSNNLILSFALSFIVLLTGGTTCAAKKKYNILDNGSDDISCSQVPDMI